MIATPSVATVIRYQVPRESVTNGPAVMTAVAARSSRISGKTIQNVCRATSNSLKIVINGDP